MAGMPFEPHVVAEYYAIENRLGANDPHVRCYPGVHMYSLSIKA